VPTPSIAAERLNVVQNVPDTAIAPVAETADDRSNVVQKVPELEIAPVAATAAERMWTRIALDAIAPVAAMAADRSRVCGAVLVGTHLCAGVRCGGRRNVYAP
jgi:hypothetical protein